MYIYRMRLFIKLLLFISIVSSSTPSLKAQTLTVVEKKWFKVKEDSLKHFARQVLYGREASQRFRADSHFTRLLVRTLVQKNSFSHRFDSLITISKLYPSDSSFRIFTWQVVKDDNYCRQKGFIQMKTKDGALKLFPLIDYSEFISDYDSITTHSHWIGAIYYRMIEKKYQNNTYYTLLGYDENDVRTARKWIDLLWFDHDDIPVFGKKNAFIFENDSIKKPSQQRFLLEYRKDGRARIQYDEELDMLIYDHLVSETNEPQKKYTLIPDGDYEGFRWINGSWQHVSKVFDLQLEDGKAPVPLPIKNNGVLNTPKR